MDLDTVKMTVMKYKSFKKNLNIITTHRSFNSDAFPQKTGEDPQSKTYKRSQLSFCISHLNEKKNVLREFMHFNLSSHKNYTKHCMDKLSSITRSVPSAEMIMDNWNLKLMK